MLGTWGALQIQDRSRKQVLRSHWTGLNHRNVKSCSHKHKNMADYRRKIACSILMNELHSSLDTEEQFSAMSHYVTAERYMDNTGVLAASAVVTKTAHDVLTYVQSYYETTVPLYSVNSFKSHFRMQRSTVQVRVLLHLCLHALL